MELLINQGADVSASNKQGLTPLIQAVHRERLDLVTALLNHGADPNAKDREGNTALMWSAWWWWESDVFYGGREENSAKIAAALLEKGADMDAANNQGMTALMRAAGWHHDTLVQFLVDHGANIQLTDKEGATALTWGARDGTTSQTVRLLREKGVEVGVLDAILMSNRSAAMEALKKGMSIQVRGPYGASALMATAEQGYDEMVRALLERGADPNAHDNRGLTPLILAIGGRMQHSQPGGTARMAGNPSDPARFAIIRSLTAKGASLNYRVPASTGSDFYAHEMDGITPLQMAILHSPLPVIQYLIENGADLNQAGQQEMTPLMTAADSGYSINWAGGMQNAAIRMEIAKLLIAKGADVNRQPPGGQTALMKAVEEPALVSLLLNHGAKVNLKDSRGANALMYAARAKKSSVSLLLARGADFKARDQYGCTALTYASESYDYGESKAIFQQLRKTGSPVRLIDAVLINDPKTIKLRIARGASANAFTPDGRPALMIAAVRGNSMLVRLLLKQGADPKRISETKGTVLAEVLLEKEYGSKIMPAGISPSPDWMETARLLLEAGANINAPDRLGTPPLFSAIISEDVPMVRLLLKYHPDLKLRYNGRTALEWAQDRENKKQELVRLLASPVK